MMGGLSSVYESEIYVIVCTSSSFLDLIFLKFDLTLISLVISDGLSSLLRYKTTSDIVWAQPWRGHWCVVELYKGRGKHLTRSTFNANLNSNNVLEIES